MFWQRQSLTGSLLIALTVVACSPDPQPVSTPPEWKIVTTGAEQSFRGLSAVTPEIVWASGTGGTVIRTVDGGRTWTERNPTPSELDFRDIQAFDADQAIVISAGHPARIFVTHDGGASWRQTYEDLREGIFFDAMAFWDRENGLAFGDPIDGRFVVITTQDGGESWQPLAPEQRPAALEGEAGFAASGSCLTVHGDRHVWFGTGGTAARVFRSDDRGQTWTVSDTPLASGANSKGIFSLAFADADVGVAVGGDYSAPTLANANVALTTDGGRSWITPESGPAGFRSAIRFVSGDARLWVAVGSDGSGFSIDGGRSWSGLGAQGFNAVDVACSGKGEPPTVWAIGADGVAGRLQGLESFTPEITQD